VTAHYEILQLETMTHAPLPLPKTDPLISVQVSVYALDGQVREAVHAYLDALDATGIDRDTGTMSTVVWGEAAAVWLALQSAYEAVATKHSIIVNTSMSNAAPLPARAAGRR
jgi:uncharacterized protein YqgV (UPF0045/DUF77 family)